MTRAWTFGQKVGLGFAALVTLVVVIAAGATYAIQSVSTAKDRVITVDASDLQVAARLWISAERKSSALRAFLLVRDAESLDTVATTRQAFLDALRTLRGRITDAARSRLLDDIERAEAAHQAATVELVALRQGEGTAEGTGRQFQERALPRMKELRAHVTAFMEGQQKLLEQATRDATAAAERATSVLLGIAALAALLAVVVALVLTRTLGLQIGSAVQHVQSSSSELQTAANQQATGAKEQASAMSEITTTISELLTTSRQIAESSQRVAHIADDAVKAARSGEQTVAKTSESIGGIKRQVDLIVTHMLDLGKKSQQIGGILELINELAEQTNILAINATIEAAGAGESGRRFGVVADEIRKLADRVSSSTKEIRGLIDEIRAAVNTTVMTTEGGTKAVDTGARQFSDVAQAFKQIMSLVGTTTEAAREIELSTKQQATAIEQVNVAVANVAQATRETEASSTQTFQTATQLTTLSRELLKLIQPQATA